MLPSLLLSHVSYMNRTCLIGIDDLYLIIFYMIGSVISLEENSLPN